MFSVGDLREMQDISDALEAAGYETYLPERDGLEVGKVMAILHQPGLPSGLIQGGIDMVRRWVFALDVYQLLGRCGSVVFNLDGRVPDDGSVVETAAAFASGKPIVIYKTTPVTMLAGEDNPMVQYLSPVPYVDDLKAIPETLTKVIAATKPSGYTPPPGVKAHMDTGATVWKVLEEWRAAEPVLDDLLKLLIKLAGLLPPPPAPPQAAKPAPAQGT
jgi:hypothetical protein